MKFTAENDVKNAKTLGLWTLGAFAVYLMVTKSMLRKKCVTARAQLNPNGFSAVAAAHEAKGYCR